MHLRIQLSNRIFFVTAITVGICLLAYTPSHCEVVKQTDRLAELREITGQYPPVSAAERVKRCIELLQKEMASPSAPVFGEGGGPIDTGYIQNVIMGSVCTAEHRGRIREEIRAAIADKIKTVPESDKALRERLSLMLCLAGKKSMLPQVLEIMEHHPDGFMRFQAVAAIREAWAYSGLEISDAAIDALQSVMETDNYASISFGGCFPAHDSKTKVISVSRKMAAEVLRLNGVQVRKGTEELDAKYGVARLNPLLYTKDTNLTQTVVGVLGAIGGPEAEGALQAFIWQKSSEDDAKSCVEEARQALARLRSGK